MTTKKSLAGDITDAKKLDKKSTVGSLAKGFKVLEAFSTGYQQMTISDVSKVTGLDAGTVFRNLNTLVDLGYLKKDADAKLFSLTFKVLDLGFHAIGRSDVRDLVLPVLRRPGCPCWRSCQLRGSGRCGHPLPGTRSRGSRPTWGRHSGRDQSPGLHKYDRPSISGFFTWTGIRTSFCIN